MINLTEKEANYCIETFKKLLEDKENYEKKDDYRYYLDNLDEDYINEAKELLKMDLNIDRVNKWKTLNDRFISTFFWLMDMWMWLDSDYSIDEVKSLVKDEDYCSIYEKIINQR